MWGRGRRLAPSKRAFGGRDRVGLARVGFNRVAQGAGHGFERGFNDVVAVEAMEAVDVQGNATVGGERLEELAHQFSVKGPDFLGWDVEVADQERPRGQVQRAAHLCIIHSQVAFAVAADAALVAECLAQGLTDTDADILKMVVLNRYNAAAPAIAFVRNFGLKQGAIAGSVAHDSHNIIAVGVSDADLAAAINLVVEAQGGVSLADGDRKEVLPLPVAGLMSAINGYEAAAQYEAMDNAAKKLGSPLNSPFMTLSFCALLVIPHLKLSDLGLFDGDTFSFVPLYKDN